MNGELILTADTYDVGRIAINNAFSGTAYFNNTQATGNVTGGTYYSGATPLSTIIQSFVSGIATAVQPGTNIITGGTLLLPTINTVPSPHFNNLFASGTSQLGITTASSFSGGTVSGGTFISGSTNLYSIFQTVGDVDSFIPLTGTNGIDIVTGNVEFTDGFGVIWNVGADSIFYNGATGQIEIDASNAFDIASGVLASGGTDLYDIFATSASSGTSANLWSASTGSNSIIANNATGNLASGLYSLSTGSGTTASGTSSYAGGIAAISNNYAEWARSSGSLGQYGFVSYFGQTTTNAATELFLDGGSLNKRFIIPTNTSVYARMTIVGRLSTGVLSGSSVQFKGEGIIKNVNGTVSLVTDIFVGTPFVMTSTIQDVSFSSTTAVVSADTTHKALALSISTLDAQTVNWFATVQYDKVN